MIAKNFIINTAKEVGFDLAGVVRIEPLTKERNIFYDWMLSGNHSTLSYLERNIEKRFDAGLLVEGAQSVVICAVSYLSIYSRGYSNSSKTKIASYALARDYHATIKEMLTLLGERLKAQYPTLHYRAFTDSAPVAEKSLAVRAGFGWIGRNSLVVTPKFGSMILLGELIIDHDVDSYDSPIDSVGCGECHRCVDSCPNGAILNNRSIDTRRCISCRTIERESETTINLDGWIFGCDACQSACPYNLRAEEHTNVKFDPLFDPTTLTPDKWLDMSEEEFLAMAGTTPMTRSGLERLKRNVLLNTSSEKEE